MISTMLMQLTDGGAPDVCYSFHARPALESQQDREADILEKITGVEFRIMDGFGSKEKKLDLLCIGFMQ